MIKRKWSISLLKHVYKLLFLFIFLNINSVHSYAANKVHNNIIAVIDIDYVIRSSNKYQALKTKLDAQHAKYQKEIAEYENEIIQLDKKINEEKEKLTNSELEILKNDLNKREIKIQRLIQQRRISLDESHAKQLEKIKTNLLEIIKATAHKKGYKVILSKANIIYNLDSIDISDKILREFNQLKDNE